MQGELTLYISAAPDLEPEREILGRAITEVPVDLAWRVVQSPRADRAVDWEAVARADLHLLLLGGDIRAPVGLEWLAARRAGRAPVLLSKEGVLRTAAGQEFYRFLAAHARWRSFRDGTDLRRTALGLLASHLLDRALEYGLSPWEMTQLRDWREGLRQAGGEEGELRRGGAGESAVVLSPGRYVPADGILLRPDGTSSPAEDRR